MIKSLKKAFNHKTILFEKINQEDSFIMNVSNSIFINMFLTIVYCINIAFVSIILIIPFTILDFILKIIYFFEIAFFKKYILLKKKKELLVILKNYANDCEKQINGYLALAKKHEPENFLEIPKDITLQQFIKTLVRQYNYKYDTVFVKNDYSARVQCFSGKRRSLGDIYLICKYYYPNCRIEEVLTILINLLQERKIYGSYCSTINKYVFHLSSTFTKTNCEVEYTEDYEFSEFVKIFGKDEQCKIYRMSSFRS